MKIIKDLENTTGEERVKALGLFSLEMGGLITPFLTREGYLDVGAGWPASLPFSRGQTRGTTRIAQLKGLQSDSGVSVSPRLTSTPLEVGGGVAGRVICRPALWLAMDWVTSGFPPCCLISGN